MPASFLRIISSFDPVFFIAQLYTTAWARASPSRKSRRRHRSTLYATTKLFCYSEIVEKLPFAFSELDKKEASSGLTHRYADHRQRTKRRAIDVCFRPWNGGKECVSPFTLSELLSRFSCTSSSRASNFAAVCLCICLHCCKVTLHDHGFEVLIDIHEHAAVS